MSRPCPNPGRLCGLEVAPGREERPGELPCPVTAGSGGAPLAVRAVGRAAAEPESRSGSAAPRAWRGRAAVFWEFTQKSDLKIAEFLGFVLLRKMAFVSESPALQTVSRGSYVYFWKRLTRG